MMRCSASAGETPCRASATTPVGRGDGLRAPPVNRFHRPVPAIRCRPATHRRRQAPYVGAPPPATYGGFVVAAVVDHHDLAGHRVGGEQHVGRVTHLLADGPAQRAEHLGSQIVLVTARRHPEQHGTLTLAHVALRGHPQPVTSDRDRSSDTSERQRRAASRPEVTRGSAPGRPRAGVHIGDRPAVTSAPPMAQCQPDETRLYARSPAHRRTIVQ